MVISQVNQNVYNGDGINKSWPYTFEIIDKTDVHLILQDVDGTQTVLTSDYYIDEVNATAYYPGYAPGAEPPEADQPPVVAEGQKIIVYRDLPLTQEADLGESWPFYVIEKGLDKLTMLLQDVWGWADRNFMKLKNGAVAWGAENYPIQDVRNPVLQQDAATKNYVDSIIAGIIAQGGNAVVIDNVATMRATTDLTDGMFVATGGYYEVNDGGAACYRIRSATPADVDDSGSVIILDNGNVAELITDGVIKPEWFGAVGDGVTDDSASLQAAIDYALANNKILLGTQTYKVESQITIGKEGTLYGFVIKLYKIVSTVVGYAVDMKGFWMGCTLEIDEFISTTGGLINCVTNDDTKTWIEYTRFISNYMQCNSSYHCIHWEATSPSFINQNEINVLRFNGGAYGAYLVNCKANLFNNCGFETAGLYLDACLHTTCLQCRMAEIPPDGKKILKTVGYTTDLVFVGGALVQVTTNNNIDIDTHTRGTIFLGDYNYKIFQGKVIPQTRVALTDLESTRGTITNAFWAESGSIGCFECTFTVGANNIPANYDFIDNIPEVASKGGWAYMNGGQVGMVMLHKANGVNKLYTVDGLTAGQTYDIFLTYSINRFG